MFEFEGQQYSLEEITLAAKESKLSVSDYLKKHNIKKLEETVEPVEKLKDVAVKDAAVTSSPELASESMESGLEDTSSEYQEPSERDLLVFDIQETERQIKNYIDQGGEVNESDAKVLQGYKNKLAKIDSGDADKPSLLENYIGLPARAFAETAAGFDKIKDATKFALLEVGLKAFSSKYKGTVEDKRALMEGAKMDVGLGFSGVVDNNKAIDSFVEKIDPMIREYENESMTDDIAEGNYLLAGERAIGAALESMPSVAMAALGPGGFVALALSTAGGKFEEEFEKDPSIGTGVLMANALGNGTIEAGFEIATRGILKRAGFLANNGNKKSCFRSNKRWSRGLGKKPRYKYR